MKAKQYRSRMYPNLVRTGMSGMLLDMFEEFGRPYGAGLYPRYPRYSPQSKMEREYHRVALYRLKKRGWVTESRKDGKKFLRFTKKGRIKALLCAFKEIKSTAKDKWDGKWRVGLFDIPEQGRHERDLIRRTLKKVGFKKLQKSVYVYPFEIPAEVLAYLRESGLDRFIRFMRVDKMDDDLDLRKKFKL